MKAVREGQRTVAAEAAAADLMAYFEESESALIDAVGRLAIAAKQDSGVDLDTVETVIERLASVHNMLAAIRSIGVSDCDCGSDRSSEERLSPKAVSSAPRSRKN